jgi:hypothetical protein
MTLLFVSHCSSWRHLHCDPCIFCLRLELLALIFPQLTYDTHDMLSNHH